ncbi:MAG: hypothetical protein U5K75_00220 [Ahrensia sp.]|nr:hypothetical protein [Ahrensia sp.]
MPATQNILIGDTWQMAIAGPFSGTVQTRSYGYDFAVTLSATIEPAATLTPHHQSHFKPEPIQILAGEYLWVKASQAVTLIVT